MYIRIVNKNRIANNNTFTDFQRYDLDEGCVYTNNYNEELDNMQCRISNINVEIEIEPFDRAVIYDNDNNILNVMLVYNWQSTMNGYRGDATYTYELQLCSLTKQLENVVLPDLSITPHKVGTKLSIYDYISRYINLYYPKIKSGASSTRTIQLDSTISTKFSNDAPELQWNTPTLREVLTSLMMVNDCIPVIKWQNNREELSYIDLTQKKDAITTYNYIQRSQSADNYVSELRMDMKNVLQTEKSEVNNTIITSEYIHFNSDSSLMTTKNIYLETQFPILNIKHLWAGYYVSSNLSSNDYIFQVVDLCNLGNVVRYPNDNGTLIYEKKEYDTLNILNRCISSSHYEFEKISDYFSQYQNYCIYYTRGSNKIDGFSKEVKKASGDISTAPLTTIEWLKILIGLCSTPQHTGFGFPTNKTTNAYFSTYFKIEYETPYDQVFQASKQGKQHHRVIADNQTNSWVDATTQGNLEYQKANRLGNEIVLINQRVSSLANAIECADYLDDNIVYKTEYQIYSDHIDVNAYATKNYILQDYWTGINSKIRTWVNAQEEAFRRQELRKFYCEFDRKAHNDSSVDFEDLTTHLLSPFDNLPHYSPIKYVGVYSKKGLQTIPSDYTKCYLLNCLNRVIGKSIVLSFGFNDNWIVGRTLNSMIDRDDISVEDNSHNKITPVVNSKITDDNDDTKYFGGIPFVNLQYGFDGELDKINYKFATNSCLAISNGTKIFESDLNGATKDIAKDFAFTTFIKPLAEVDLIEDYIDFEDEIDLYKDNKEIPTINTQFEFLSATDDILVTEQFVNVQKWVANYDTSKPYSIYEAPVSAWNLRSNQLPSGATQLSNSKIKIDYTGNNRAKLTIYKLIEDVPYPTTNNKAYYVVIDNKVALAFKGSNDQTDIYFNVLLNRDTNIYNAQGIITGEI